MEVPLKGEELYYFREKRDIAISFRQAVYLRLLPRIAKTVWYGQTMVAVIQKMFHWSYLQIFKSVKLGKTSIRQKSHWMKKRIFTYSKCGANAWQILRLCTFA